MKFPIHFPALLLMGMAVSQVAPQPTMPRLEPLGLAGERVTALHFSPVPYKLYATTDGSGVYQHDPIRSDSLWLRLGLYGKKITALELQVWGVGPTIAHRPIVGVAPDYAHGDSTLIYRLENARWVPADSGIMKGASITSLSSFTSTAHEPPRATFAASGGLIYRSNSWNRWWTEVFNFGLGWYVYVTTITEGHPREAIWLGGIQEGALAWLAKSTQYGEAWEDSSPPAAVLDDNACYALAIHPDSANIVYAGMYGAVIKTTDGGTSWRLTGLENNQTYLYGLALDVFDPHHVYAGGSKANQWALWESFNGGTNWQEIPAPPSMMIIQGISSLVADPNATGVVYAGTLGGGVWRYQSEVLAVQDRHEEAAPQDFVLEQNYPNPFSPTGRFPASYAGYVGTVIRFEIPSALANASARLAIYNLRGELVRELLNRRLPAGNHFAHWDGTNDAGSGVSSGIYFYCLQVMDSAHNGAGGSSTASGEIFTKMKKLVLLK